MDQPFSGNEWAVDPRIRTSATCGFELLDWSQGLRTRPARRRATHDQTRRACGPRSGRDHETKRSATDLPIRVPSRTPTYDSEHVGPLDLAGDEGNGDTPDDAEQQAE